MMDAETMDSFDDVDRKSIVSVKTNAVAEFKKPSAVKNRSKPKILTEETYIEEMAKIIQRDFFPDLDRLRAQNEYLEAMERKDFARVEAIRAKYSGLRPTERGNSMTPATFETPSSSAAGATPHQQMPATVDATGTPSSMLSFATSCGSKRQLSDRHSLDSFLQAYTSEDNHSFQEIIKVADEKVRQKFAVLYNEEELSVAMLARTLDLPSIEQQFSESDPLRKIETWTYKTKNSIMYIPDGVALTDNELIEGVDSKRTVIHHNATRLRVNPFEAPATVETAKSVVSARVDQHGAATIEPAAPQVRGFDLLKTPSPRPGEAFSPLMTWGEIEGTPFRLDGSDTPIRSNAGPSFKITENSRRENIALALAEKVGEKMRAQKQRALNTAKRNISSPFMRSNMERLASMSPAARRLVSAKLGLRSPSLTPVLSRTPEKTATKRSAAKARATPTAPPTEPKELAAAKTTLTDNLLKIPTKKSRPNAADFF